MLQNLEIFAPDASKLWQQAGYISSLETIVLGIPIAIWGMGTVEEILRTTLECSKVVLNTVFRQPTMSNITQLNKEFQITKGCLVLTGMSCLPLFFKTIPYAGIILRIPAYYIASQTYSKISEQTLNYTDFRSAVERAERHIIAGEADFLAERICELESDEKIDAITDTLLNQLRNGVKVTQEDLDNSARQLQGTLIYRNWSYTAAYFFAEKTYSTSVKVVDTSVEALKTAFRLAKFIFNLGLVKNVVKFAVTEVVKEYGDVFDIPKMPVRPGVG
ncbi:MAG: hypothetical protein H0U49_01220, partial [Parachlamydiaceae bacterium]|nr:hypothetical protein [Parachlamydiaceae bacterium]